MCLQKTDKSSSGYDGYQAGDEDNSIGRTQSRMRHCLRLQITHVDEILLI
jgi:hypothetical protein